ncbi:MAG TPA: hypothetical protein PK954_25040, partial [Anaerolineales bacterium]|nr:hypothetical protein [Anaerolineales bacterium]
QLAAAPPVAADGEQTLDRLPHVLSAVGTSAELDTLVKRMKAEYDEETAGKLRGQSAVYAQQDPTKRTVVMIIDHYDDIESINKTKVFQDLAELGKGKNLHIVLAGSLNITRTSLDDVRKRAESSRYSIILQDFETVRYMGVRGINASSIKDLPAGRGFAVKSISAALSQFVLPVIEGKNGFSADEQLAGLFNAIRRRHGNIRARWSYFNDDLTALNEALGVAAAAPGAPTPAGAAQTGVAAVPAYDPALAAAMGEESIDIDALLAEQAAAQESATIAMPTKLNFAEVLVERDEEEAPPGENGATAPEAKKEST